MVEQLELANQNVKFIAESIDVLLKNLLPDWKPCVAIDHLVSPHGILTQANLQRETVAEDAVPSALCGRSEAVNENLDNADMCSEMSYASASSDFNDNKLSVASFMSAESGFDRGSQSSFESEIGASPHDYDDKFSDPGSNDMMSFSSYPVSVSSLSEPEDELRIELEVIEQKYQEALKILSESKNQAIMEIKRRMLGKMVS